MSDELERYHGGIYKSANIFAALVFKTKPNALACASLNGQFFQGVLRHALRAMVYQLSQYSSGAGVAFTEARDWFDKVKDVGHSGAIWKGSTMCKRGHA